MVCMIASVGFLACGTATESDSETQSDEPSSGPNSSQGDETEESSDTESSDDMSATPTSDDDDGPGSSAGGPSTDETSTPTNEGGAGNDDPLPTANPTTIMGGCPPCVAPPAPGCIGEGPCGCGPYVCPDTSLGAGGNSQVDGMAGAGGGASDDSPDGLSCRDVADCNDLDFIQPECFSPGDSPDPPPFSCGAPDWCGECSCPTQPAGLYTQCSTDVDCPAPAEPDEVSLPFCDTETLACEGCLDDADCSVDTPHCVELYLGARALKRCGACEMDTDCPAETPRCLANYDDPLAAPACVECLNSSECAMGICVGNSCRPECDPSDDGCSPSGTSQCNPETLRCERRSCATAADCGTHIDCEAGQCSRRACEADSECDAAGHCVNGYCFDAFGLCEDTYYTLPP